MQYQFNQSVHLAKKNYLRGIQEVPEGVEKDPYFLKLVGLGLITEAEATRVVTKETLKEKSERLLEKLTGKKSSEEPKAAIPKAEAKEKAEDAEEDEAPWEKGTKAKVKKR